MAKVHLKREIALDEFLRQLTEGALVVFRRQQKEKFDDVALKHELRRVIKGILKIDMEVAEECGLSLYCHESTLSPPWSGSAEEALQADQEEGD